MRHLTKAIAIAITMTLFTLIGCNGGITNEGISVTNNTNSAVRTQTSEVTLRVDSEGLFTFGSDARTILPAAVDSTKLHFFLVYKDIINSSSESFSPIEFVKDTSITTYTVGSITRSFALSDYTFKLYAVYDDIETASASDATNVASQAAFVGYANADLRYNDVVTFHMKANSDSSSGKGKLNLTLKHAGNWKIPANFQVTAGIYNIDTDAIVYPKPETGAKQVYARVASEGTFAQSTLDSTSYEVPQGEYNLIIRYNYQPAAAGTTTKYYEYSEKIVILMNQETTATIDIPAILEEKPAKPTNFTAAFNNPDNINNNYFSVRFDWVDNAKNEREYKIELLKIVKSGSYVLPTDQDSWTSTATGGNAVIFTKDKLQNTEYLVDGSLNKNSTNVVLKLPMEERYAARICASNAAGDSDWTYVVMNTSTITGWENFPTGVTTINRFKITYDLNGGQFFDDGSAAAALSTPPALTFYTSQYTNTSGASPAVATDRNIILSPDGITTQKWFKDLAGKDETGTAAALTLVADNNFWDKWTKDSDSGDVYAQTVTYEAKPGTYVQNIKYYPKEVTTDTEAETKALAAQPTASTYSNTEFTDAKVRKAVSSVYTECANLYLVAHYDTTRTFGVEIEDVSIYELTAEMIKTAFKKDAADVTAGNIDYADSVAGNSIATLDDVTNKLLEVSLSKVNNITFTVDTAGKAKFPVTTYDPATNTISAVDGSYNKVHLKISSFDGRKVLIDKDWETNAWVVNFKTWKYGKYKLEFTAQTSEMPGVVYSYDCVLSITQ